MGMESLQRRKLKKTHYCAHIEGKLGRRAHSETHQIAPGY